MLTDFQNDLNWYVLYSTNDFKTTFTGCKGNEPRIIEENEIASKYTAGKKCSTLKDKNIVLKLDVTGSLLL